MKPQLSINIFTGQSFKPVQDIVIVGIAATIDTGDSVVLSTNPQSTLYKQGDILRLSNPGVNSSLALFIPCNVPILALQSLYCSHGDVCVFYTLGSS